MRLMHKLGSDKELHRFMKRLVPLLSSHLLIVEELRFPQPPDLLQLVWGVL